MPPFPIKTLAVSILLALPIHSVCAEELNQQDTPVETESVTVYADRYTPAPIAGGTGMAISAQETPQAISVVDSETMSDWNMTSINDVLDNVIGVSSKRDDDVRTEYQSRGFDIGNIQIDGVPYRWSDYGNGMGEALADMAIYQRVEVIRGSTGLTSGVGDPSASINMVRKHADSDRFQGNVDATLGSWDQRSIMADVQNALNDDGSLRGRIVAKYSEQDSYVDLYHSERKVLYGVLEKDVTANTLVRIGGNYQSDDIDGASWGGLSGVFSDGSATHFSRSKTTAADWSYWNTENKSGFIDIEHDFDNGWLWQTSYNHIEYQSQSKLLYMYPDGLEKSDGSGLVAYPEFDHSNSKQDSINTQLSGQYQLFGRDHDFTLGAMYSCQKRKAYEIYAQSYDQDIDDFYTWRGEYTEPEWSSSPYLAGDLETEQQGIYASTRFNVSQALKIILGSRIENWQREGTSYSADASYGDDGIFMPYAGALYDFTPQTRGYVSYATIYQPQSAQNSAGEFLDPVEGATYELGLKNRYLDDRLTLSFAVFRIEEDNLAQDDPTGATIPNSTDVAQVEADGVTSKGFEVQVGGTPVEGLQLNAGYTQFKARDAEGKEVNTDYARKQLKLMSSYQFVSLLPELTIGAALRWQDKVYAGDITQSAYSLVDMMAKYQLTQDMVVNLAVNNVFDKSYYNYLDSSNEVHYGEPVNASLSVNYAF